MAQTKIINDTAGELTLKEGDAGVFTLKEGDAGVFRRIVVLEPKGEYALHVNCPDTYREFWMVDCDSSGGTSGGKFFCDMSITAIAEAVDSHGAQLDMIGAQMDRLTSHLQHKRGSKFKRMMLVMVLLVTLIHAISSAI